MTELEHFIRRNDVSTFGRVCSIAISIKTRDDDYCDNHNCGECDFCKNKDEILKILLSEHKEKPKITDDEKAILRNLPKKCKYIIRNWNNKLFLTEGKPQKKGDYYWSYKGYCYELDIFEHLFQFIKWEDEEPWSIKKLLEE